ncbi:MAG: hypothetical protein P8164_15340 [Gammaproteobacteria bacterium]|jgi:hypothetical protein
MNGKYLLLPLVLGWLLASSPVVMADTAMQEMVGIMLTLHHYPSDSDKVTLHKIINDSASTQDERTIAEALMRMHHTVTDDDKAKLLAISHNESAPAADRKVAEILANMHHKASAGARAELEKLK